MKPAGRYEVSTDAAAIAAAVFGAYCREPGTHISVPDAEGWVWMLVVSDTAQVMQCAFMPEALAGQHTRDTLLTWRSIAANFSAPRLRLLK